MTTCDVDVTCVRELFTPRVFDDPVVTAFGIGAIANHRDRVIDRFALDLRIFAHFLRDEAICDARVYNCPEIEDPWHTIV